MSDTKYNGWTNYPTWRVNLEFAEDYLEGIGDGTFADTYSIVHALKEACDEWISEACPDDTVRGWTDAFVSDVNWYEIAEAHPELIASDDDDDTDDGDAEGDN